MDSSSQPDTSLAPRSALCSDNSSPPCSWCTGIPPPDLCHWSRCRQDSGQGCVFLTTQTLLPVFHATYHHYDFFKLRTKSKPNKTCLPQNSICHEEQSTLMTIFTLRTIPATRTNVWGRDAGSCYAVIASSAQACGLRQGIAVAVVTCNHNANHACQCLHRYRCHSSNL